ncbi:MAG: hypothetical protein A2X05_06600 [Bacteroidetes bacterium GWE2_41_25]|nr:MAG: hypothetical protein A2X03_01310 [Bacteroidetes bacterium GWA2_40_15]OFX95723.1 MAG: hypothetical protein A2X06_07260 [Bacteroidetes bacterium GWC2_40_22]OFY00845.1 MAG: hypothetical protein A2X05_06600 [Bacteroidetes bacterium GWE2_41_25]OFY58248.1 MAG: hypothetical protein A2X04_07070 [Bacteroidetes bacterium GWF2_41_9]HBH83628.1 hypothetical protein [Bacteroidales bacterium]
MSDNGYFHGEHGLADKWYPYQKSIKVPLIVHDPRLSENRRNIINDEFILNIDIAPSILASTGLTVPQRMQGVDFSDLYLEEKPVDWRKDFFYEHPYVTNEERIPSSEALVTHSEKYILWPHYDFEEFFDLVKDPFEVSNAINDRSSVRNVESMKKRFLELKENAK